MFTHAESRMSVMADLVIEEFDQWSNPKDPKYSPTSICWYGEEAD